MLLEGRSAIITGGSRGLGKAIVQAFVANGCKVAVCSRDAKTLKAAVKELEVNCQSSACLLPLRADISRENEVERLVDEAIRNFGRLDVLVNNAAILGPIGPSESVDWREWLRTIEINLTGPMLLCRAAIRLFKEQKYGKIVNISGGGAANPRPRFSAYAASKAALVRLTETLAEEVKEFDITVNAMAPGALNSDMLDEVLAAGPERVGADAFEQALAQKRNGGSSMEKAAALCVFLASDASRTITGKLISAVWDPWESLPDHKEQLVGTDVYTLRRVVPKDRGMSWE